MANLGSNNVSVIDGATNTVTATIVVGSSPYSVSVNPTTNKIYVANPGSNNVSVIDGATNTVTATITVGSNPSGVVVNPATNKVYVTNAGSNNVYVVDGATNMVTTTVVVGAAPYGVDVIPATNKVYVTNAGSNNVSVIDGATNTVTATIAVGNSPYSAGANPATSKIYVSNYYSNSVSVIYDPFTITASAGAGGSISPSGAVGVNPGASQAFTIAADTGYHVSQVFVDGVYQGTPTGYTFSNVAADHSISAQFAINTYTISTSVSGGHGSIQGAQSIDYSESASIAITPDAGYHIATITDNGLPQTVSSPYVISNVTAAHNVVATFALNAYTVNASVFYTGHGNVDVVTPSVSYGGTATIDLIPDPGYRVAYIMDNGAPATVADPYVIPDVREAHDVIAFFATDTHTLITHVVGSGTVTLNPPGGVYDYGTSVGLTAEPAAGWHFTGWTGDLTGTINPQSLDMTTDHAVTATFSTDTYTINASAGGNGSISPAGAVSVNSGANQSFTITPDANYHVADVLVDGVSAGALTSYTFTNVTASHSISASFAIDTYQVNASVFYTGHGSVNPAAQTVSGGTSASVDLIPETGYHVAYIMDNGIPRTVADPYVVSNVTETHNVIVFFTIDTYSITTSVDGDGTADGAGTYDYGDTVTLTAIPDTGRHFVNWTEGGAVVSTDASYSFTATVARDLVAHFAIDTHTVTATAGAGGSITPSGAVVMDYGSSQAFTITPNSGWHVAGVLVDGAPQGAVTSYTFTNVTAAHTISASFAVDASPSAVWYLAEGSTNWGFNCYVSIENPNTTAVNVELTYMTSTGLVTGPTVAMPAKSQATVYPSSTLGAADFSTKVECTEGKLISVDRTMYWTGTGATCSEAHCATGVTAPAQTWYMPEGSSNWGFECWVLIQNPNDAAANCAVTWMIEGANPQTNNFSIPANSRSSFNMADYIGAADASVKVTSQNPVIAERAMYRNARREGHDSTGTTTAATDYYLAEGCSGFGFTTYILVQNPQSTPTDVAITYQAPTGPVTGPSFTVPANSRKTICVNDTTQIPGPDPSFSTRVHGSAPIIAERAMYWSGGSDSGQVCHDSIGIDAPHTSWYLADGQSSDGAETWTLVQNPNSAAVTVEITYMTPSGSGNIVKTESIPANSRRSFNMASHSGISGRAAIMVVCKTAGSKVIVERSMYWNDRGAGTDTVGGYSD